MSNSEGKKSDIEQLSIVMRKALDTIEQSIDSNDYSPGQKLDASKFLLEHAQGIAEKFMYVKHLKERE